MKVGEILVRSRKRLSNYGINYREPFNIYYDLLIANDEIKPVQVSSVLVLTDKRPRSLITIAYAFRMAQGLNANLLAITMGVHQELIKGEAKIYNINLAFLKTFSKQPSIDSILEIIRNHEIGLVVVHNLYTLTEEILDNSPVPVLVVKVDQFFRTPPSKDRPGG